MREILTIKKGPKALILWTLEMLEIRLNQGFLQRHVLHEAHQELI